MSENGSLPASPVPLCPGEGFREHGPADGLTKRELFAAMAMQGFASDPNTTTSSVDVLARIAVVWADALLAALSTGGES